MVKISTGIIKRPLRIVVDGVEGVGKTTFCSQFPDPLFIDLEDGTHSMDVKRTEKPQDWLQLLALIRDIYADPSVCRTLIIDTGDWAERLCEKYVCERQKVDGIESIGYGKGWVYLREDFEGLLRELDKAIAAGINVVIACHVQIKKFELPDEQGSFDRYELKMSKNVAPLVREWCDIQLFANFKTYVIATNNNKTHKGTGGTRRVMYASHSAAWDAKNRHGLPDEMDFDFKNIAHLFSDSPAPTASKTPLEELNALMEKDGITELEVRALVSEKGKYPVETPIADYEERFIRGWCIQHWSQIVDAIEQARGKNV